LKIWRYVDLPKFVNMLSTGTLHFACVSSFQDPYEGWLPRSYIEAMVNLIRTPLDQMRQTQNHMVALNPNPALHCALENILQDAERKMHVPRVLKEVNEKFGASCWHINEGESEAMWRLYGPTGAGIAIESTRERLDAAMKDSAPHPVHIDPVRYMDFDNDPIDKGGHRHLMGFIKRKSFEHERELRALVMLPEPGKGASVPCDMNTLIARIHIAPQAKGHYIDAVHYVIGHADPRPDAPVQISKLFDPPDYLTS
jgi:Protein of unknown function (DUF2971)